VAKPEGVQALPAAVVQALVDDVFQAAAAVTASLPFAPGLINLAKGVFDANWPAIATWLESKGWLTP
jgi:hypothetical protein